MEKVKPTIKGRLIVNSSAERAWLFLLMRNFKDAVEYAHSLMRRGLSDGEIVKLLTSRILNNAHYSYSALQKAKLYCNQPYLKLRKPQLFSVGKGNEKGNRNIRFESVNKVKIKIPSASGRHRWIIVEVKFGRKYIPVIRELVGSEIPYGAGVYLKEKRIELHVNTPLELYVKYLSRVSKKHKPIGHIASLDFNSDRINMVIVNEEGRILDVRSEYFPEVTSHGFPKEKAMDLRLKALNRLVSYAHHHGVSHYVAEKLGRPKKKIKSRKANRKVSKFALREYINHLEILIPKYGGKLHFINAAYTSVGAIPLAEKLGLDTHTASAYLLALRYLKSTNAYQYL